MSFRATLNEIKQRYRLNLDYEEEVLGPNQAHVWCGTWKLSGYIIGEGTAATKAGAKEAAARPAIEWLQYKGYFPQ